MSSFNERLRAQGPLLGAYIMVNATLSAHLIGSSGFDWVLIDMEHSPMSAADATAIVHAVTVGSHSRCLPIIRTPSSGVEYIKWALDSGAAGIIIPMVQSKAEAESIVQRARYPPLGQRSFGPFNAPWADLKEDSDVPKYFSKTAAGIAVLPMIESVQGVDNAEEIMNVKGVSGVFIGPVDLRLSMGLKGADGNEEEYIAALTKIVRIGRELALPVGIFAADDEAIKRLLRLGFNFFLVTGDTVALVNGAAIAIGNARKALENAKL